MPSQFLDMPTSSNGSATWAFNQCDSELIKRPGANNHQTWDETLQRVGAAIEPLLYHADRHIVPDLASDGHLPT